MVDLASLERKCTCKGTEGSNPSLSSRGNMKNTLKIFFVFIICLSIKSFPQSSSENWVKVYADNEKITFINVTGLSSFKEDEIMVWAMEEISSGFKMEEIDDDIYKVKSYYMISKGLKRYSLVDVIYYNKKGNVIKTYHYSHDYDNLEFKYTSPITNGSEAEKIFAKCLQVIAAASENTTQQK